MEKEEEKVEIEEPYSPFKFRKYRKIQRLGKEETEGILEGTCYVQEKVDGANTSIWLDENGVLHCGSRTRDLSKESEDGFNGFIKYIRGHVGINKFLQDNPQARLYGEWLVRHTIAYKETAYKKFYLFDVFNAETMTFADSESVQKIGEVFGIETVPLLGKFENPTVEQLTALMGTSAFGDRGEGIVIKNFDFVSKFGDLEYAKIVTESFKEDNGVVFGGNNKHSDTYWEMYVVNKYMTLARIQKIMAKIQPEVNRKLDMQHIPRVMGMAYHDMITEEAWEIANKVASLDFKTLKRVSDKKSKQIFVDILNDSISVADQK
jgi:hypothetical protein